MPSVRSFRRHALCGSFDEPYETDVAVAGVTRYARTDTAMTLHLGGDSEEGRSGDQAPAARSRGHAGVVLGRNGTTGDLVDQPLPGVFEGLRIGGEPGLGHHLEVMAQPLLELGRGRALGARTPLGPEQLGRRPLDPGRDTFEKLRTRRRRPVSRPRRPRGTDARLLERRGM